MPQEPSPCCGDADNSVCRWVTPVPTSFSSCETAPSMDTGTNLLGSAFTLHWDRQGVLCNSARAKTPCVCPTALPGIASLCPCRILTPSSPCSQGQLLVPPRWASQDQDGVSSAAAAPRALARSPRSSSSPSASHRRPGPSCLSAPPHSHRSPPRIFSTGLPLTTGYEPFSPVGNKNSD